MCTTSICHRQDVLRLMRDNHENEGSIKFLGVASIANRDVAAGEEILCCYDDIIPGTGASRRNSRCNKSVPISFFFPPVRVSVALNVPDNAYRIAVLVPLCWCIRMYKVINDDIKLEYYHIVLFCVNV